MDAHAAEQGRERQLPYVQRRNDKSMASSSSVAASAASAQDPDTDSEQLPYTINVHNPTVSYGGIDPEIEENIQFIKDVSDRGLRVPGTESGGKSRSQATKRRLSPSPFRSTKGGKTMSTIMGPAQSSCGLLQLPSELIDAIFAYLSPIELAAVSLTCRKLNDNACTDLHWQKRVLENLPGNAVSTPYPCESWRELYAAHDPHWFLPRYRIWFCDRELTGHMIVVRYDTRRGCIEGYRMVVIREAAGVETWVADDDVHIHFFKPEVKLHLDKPVLQLNPRRRRASRNRDEAEDVESTRRCWRAEHPMQLNSRSDPRHSNILLAKALDEDDYNHVSESAFPYGNIWPPPSIPASDRVVARPAGLHRLPSPDRDAEEPLWSVESRNEMSEMTFRIRHYLDLGTPSLAVALGEEISTYSTLDPSLYTPTKEKPWRGIWVGDYSGHGCEFLLLHQPEVPGEEDEEPLEREDGETDENFEARFLQQRVYRGRLEAIKLTGDPNVPRGENTFIADDLGPHGFVGVAREEPFEGARIVKSRGHIAAEGFYHDKYMESQLIMVSHNRLAQYWVGFGHISFFERVDIEQFMVPR